MLFSVIHHQQRGRVINEQQERPLTITCPNLIPRIQYQAIQPQRKICQNKIVSPTHQYPRPQLGGGSVIYVGDESENNKGIGKGKYGQIKDDHKQCKN